VERGCQFGCVGAAFVARFLDILDHYTIYQYEMRERGQQETKPAIHYNGRCQNFWVVTRTRHGTALLGCLFFLCTAQGFHLSPASYSTTLSRSREGSTRNERRLRHWSRPNDSTYSTGSPFQSRPHTPIPDIPNESTHLTPSRRRTSPASTLAVGLWLGLAATTLATSPLPAHASFGPSSGATTSATPGLGKLDDIDNLSGKKLLQLIGSTVNGARLDELQRSLDDLINSLQNDSSSDAETSTTADDDKYSSLVARLEEREQEQLAKLQAARQLQQAVVNRVALLVQLESQPTWFNYLAAFVGSVASTLVMHPVDTIKTKMQIASSSSSQDIVVMNEDASTIAVVMNGTEAPLLSVTPSRELDMIPPSGNLELMLEENETEGSAIQVLVQVKQEETAVVEHLHEHDELEVARELTFFEKVGPLPSLYKGLLGNIIKEGPPSALYLGVYESVKLFLLKAPGGLAAGTGPLVLSSSTSTNPGGLIWIYLLSGAAGETIGSVVRAPAEAIKSLVQAGESLDAAVARVFGDSQGRTNVFRAWSASLLRDVPFGAIQIALFELIKAFIINSPSIDFDSTTLAAEAVIGAFCGGIGAFVTTPTDVITTRIITQKANDNALGVADMARLVYAEGGPTAFFAGWKERVLYWAPAISIFLSCYCSVRQLGVELHLFG